MHRFVIGMIIVMMYASGLSSCTIPNERQEQPHTVSQDGGSCHAGSVDEGYFVSELKRRIRCSERRSCADQTGAKSLNVAKSPHQQLRAMDGGREQFTRHR